MTFLDERTDTSAVDAMDAAATPPRPPKRDGITSAPGPTFMVLFADNAGLLPGTYFTGGDWQRFSPGVLLQLVKAAHPSKEIVWCDWAERPGDFSATGGPVLLVKVSGERGVSPKLNLNRQSANQKYRKPKRRDYLHASAADVADRFDASDWRSDPGHRGLVARLDAGSTVSMPVDTSVEVVAKCCGISHTRGSYSALEMVSATEREQGDVVIHDEVRVCGACKATLAVTTTRLVGSKR